MDGWKAPHGCEQGNKPGWLGTQILFIAFLFLIFVFLFVSSFFPLFSAVINSLYVDAFHFVLSIGIIYSIPSFSLFSPFPVTLEFQRIQSLSHLIRRVEADRLLVPRCQLYTHQICFVLCSDTQIAYGTWRLLNSVIFFYCWTPAEDLSF